jgi:hypothetical protein
VKKDKTIDNSFLSIEKVGQGYMTVIRSLTGANLFNASILPTISRIKTVSDLQVKVQVINYMPSTKKHEGETLLVTFLEKEHSSDFTKVFESILDPK